MDLKTVPIRIPEGANIIIGQSHFIKTVEDLYEVMVTTAPGAAFGVAFNEASEPCLIRFDGNNDELSRTAVESCQALGAGHVFVLVMRDAYPISVLAAIKQCQEVCAIFCATANPLDVIVACTERGCGVLGVVDGSGPKGVENDQDKQTRSKLLRSIIGYKR